MVIIEPFDLDRDLHAVMRMGKEMHQSSVFKCLEFDSAKVLQLFLNADRGNQNPYFFYVARASGTTVGFFLGVAGQHFCSTDLYAIDMAVWVDVENRRTPAAELLVKEYRTWCKELGIKLPMLGCSTGVDIERTKAFYEKCGFGCVGHNFVEVQ